MSLAWREEKQASLETQPWRPISLDCISGGEAGGRREFLVKGLFQGAGYHVMLTDCSCVWEEKMDGEKIMKRLKVLVFLCTRQQ